MPPLPAVAQAGRWWWSVTGLMEGWSEDMCLPSCGPLIPACSQAEVLLSRIGEVGAANSGGGQAVKFLGTLLGCIQGNDASASRWGGRRFWGTRCCVGRGKGLALAGRCNGPAPQLLRAMKWAVDGAKRR